MTIPIEPIKYGLLFIVFVVAAAKSYQVVMQIIKKHRKKDGLDFDEEIY